MTHNRISDQLLNAISENTQLFASLNDELKAQLKTTLESQADKLGLVTREEFDTIRLSLNRCIERIEQLETELNQED